MTIQEWADETGSTKSTVGVRLKRYGSPMPRPVHTKSKIADLPWEMDAEAQRLVGEKGAMRLEEIAKHFKLSKERIRQTEVSAFKKIVKIAPWFAEMLVELDEIRNQRSARGSLGGARVRVGRAARSAA